MTLPTFFTSSIENKLFIDFCFDGNMQGLIPFGGTLASSLTLKLCTSPCLIPTLEGYEELALLILLSTFFKKFDDFLSFLVSFVFFRNKSYQLS